MWSVFEEICASVNSRGEGWLHDSFWKLYIPDPVSLQEHEPLTAYEQSRQSGGSSAHFISSSGICRIFSSSVPAENKTSTRVRTPPSLKSLLTADNRPSRVIYGPQSLLPFLQASPTPWKTRKVHSYHMILRAAVKPTLLFAQISTFQTSFPAS